MNHPSHDVKEMTSYAWTGLGRPPGPLVSDRLAFCLCVALPVFMLDTASRRESVIQYGRSPPVVFRASLECCFMAMTSQISGSKGHY